jgi:hypothetical protein
MIAGGIDWSKLTRKTILVPQERPGLFGSESV